MDLFDEWGNFVGKITGMSVGDNCLMSLVMMLVFGAGFLIYYFFKLIVEGVKALIHKDIEQTVKYLAIPAVVVIAILGFAIPRLAEGRMNKRIHSDFTEYMEANIAVTARREKCNAEVFECPYLEEQDPVLVEISNSSDYGVGYMGYFTSYEEANCSYSDEVTAHSSVAMPCGVKKWQNEICFQFYIVENNYPSGGSHVYPEVCAALR